MARLSEEFISQLKAANPIADVFGKYVNLTSRGRTYVCCCPFHVEKTPSCTIYPSEEPHFYCFGCGESGDVITFMMKIEDLPYMDAVRALADRAGMTLPIENQHERKYQVSHDKCYEINRKTANFYYDRLLRGNDKTGLQFLADHKIRPQAVKKFGIGFASDAGQLLQYLRSEQYSDLELLSAGVCRRNPDGSLSDYFRDQMILFPVLDLRGNITGFSGKSVYDGNTPWVTSPESPVFSRKKLLFGLNTARQSVTESDSRTLILAQDPLNAVAVWQNGFENVSAPPGASVTPQLVKLISQYASEVIFTQPAERNILNYFSDADIPVRLLNPEQIRTPVEYFRRHTPEEFRNLLEQARDANLIELEACQDGLNPDSQEDKAILIGRNIRKLSEIRDDLEREVYLVNIARTLQVKPDFLRIQLDEYLRMKKRQTIPRNSRLESRSLTREDMDAVNQQHRIKFQAEQQVLLFLLHNPQEATELRRILPPDCFYTNLHRNIYIAICRSVSERHPDILLFDPLEQSCVEDIRKDYNNITPSREKFTDCVSILQNTRKI